MKVDQLDLMNKYSEFTKNFCRKSRITPYQFYILSLIRGGCKSFLDLVSRFTGRETITILGETHKVGETSLRNFVNNRLKGRWVIYDKSDKYVLFQMMNDVEPLFASYEQELSDYISEMDKDIEVKQEMAKEFKKIEWKDDVTTMIPFDKLPTKLKEAYEEDADEAYRNMIEVLAYKITENDPTPEVREQIMTMPFFLAIPEEMKESNYRYFSKKLNLITGLVTSMSEITNFKFGTLVACRNVEPHIRLLDKVDDAPFPICGNTLKVITDIELPIMRITVETPDGERITAMIHADLWRPSESLSSAQQFLMFRVAENSPLKKIKNIQYLIIGTEKKQEFEVNYDDAKKVARRSTDEILSILTNSLFSDIAGNETMKRMAVLTLASINTQKMKIDYGNVKSEEIGIMNLLFWGREGTAKTRICRKAVSLVGTKLAFGQAGSSTITGLTAAYDKELKSVRMGAVPLNDTRCVLIDELDKFASRSDWTRLLEPAQERRITYNKAGIKATFKCRTALFFTANNRKDIQIQTYESLEKPEYEIIDQIKTEIHRPLIDRMDLICAVQTVGIGQDILKSLLSTKCPEVLDENRIKNYFEIIRLIDTVRIDRSIILHLQKTLSKYKINIPPRRLITLYRLISAVAKLHLRDRANISDVNEALDLYKESLTTLGELSPEILQVIEAPTNENKLGETIKNTMLKGRDYHINDLKDLIKANGSDIERVVKLLYQEGWLAETKHNIYRRAE